MQVLFILDMRIRADGNLIILSVGDSKQKSKKNSGNNDKTGCGMW